MDLILTDASWHDLCEVSVSSGDMAWGIDDNNFALTFPASAPTPEMGALLYADRSAIGGVVSGWESDSGSFTVTGDTWTGILNRHVLRPDAGQMYYKASGDVRDIVATIISRLEFTSLFEVDAKKAGITITHTFSGARDTAQADAGRYMGGWAAIWQLLLDSACKAIFRWDADLRKVRMYISPRNDNLTDEALVAGSVALKVTMTTPPNHLVCLGKGEGAARTVIDLYCDSVGKVSSSKTFTGLDEVTEIYDASYSEDDQLRADGTSKLKELWASGQKIEVAAPDSPLLSLGDVIRGTDERTGVRAAAVITKVVATAKETGTTYAYKTTTR